MLATILLADRKPWIAGLLLGMALSKYSLSLGILVLFTILELKPVLIIAAGLVQGAGIVGLMLLSRSGFMEILGEYIQMALWHAGREGIHLAAALHAEKYYLWIALALTLAVGTLLALWHWKKAMWELKQSLSPLSRYHMAVILILWGLLVGYHRAYDVMVVIVFFILIAYLVKQPTAWDLSRRARVSLEVFTAIAMLLLMIPSGNMVRSLLPLSLETLWGKSANLIATILIAIFLVLTFILLFRLKDVK
jgi:hypothetical protein